MTTTTTLNALTTSSVSVDTAQFDNINGKLLQIGNTQTKSYRNSPTGRNAVITDLPEVYQDAIFAVWGETATLED